MVVWTICYNFIFLVCVGLLLLLCHLRPHWFWRKESQFFLFFVLNFSPQDWGTATLSDSWIYLHCRRKCLEHCLSDNSPGQVFHPTNLNHCLLTSIQVRLDEQIAITRCHKSVRGTSKWVKRELLEMEEGRSKEEAKHLLKVIEHQGAFWLPWHYEINNSPWFPTAVPAMPCL